MKPTYEDFQAKKRGGVFLPPVGQYIGEIQGVRLEPSYSDDREVIICMVEITEGEYKNQYHKVFEDQKERFGDNVKYRGTFKLTPYKPGDELWIKNRWEENLNCIQESNPGYKWDWDETKLKGKKIGLNIRENNYIGKNDGKPHTTTEVGQFEIVSDVRAGTCRDMRPRGKKQTESSSENDEPVSGNSFTPVELCTDVTGKVEVPF